MRFHKYLEDLIGSDVKVRIMRVLAKHPTRSFTGLEFSRELGISPGYVNKILRLYERYGILSKRPAGNSLVWSVNQHHVLFQRMESLFKFERAALDELVGYLHNWADRHKDAVKEVILFGSVARGDETAGSDIDLLVVCQPGMKDKAEDLMADVHSDVHRRYGNSVSPLVYYASEFNKRSNLARNIAKDGVRVYG